MKGSISRRSMLAGAGYALAGTAASQMLAAVAQAQEATAEQAAPGLCMTMLFMAGARTKFETDKYVKKHLPLLREVYGDSVERIEVRSSVAAAQGIPSAILASSTMWIRDVQAFGQKLGANAERINKDLDSVAKGNRLVQVDRVALQVGDARSEVTEKTHVFSMFYPSASRPSRGIPGGPQVAPPGGEPPAPTFDARFFVEAYLPKLYSLYGSSAVRRIEATLGQDQGGQKAAHVGAYHLVIRDRGDYDRKSSSVFTEMMKDSGKFTTIFPLMADMRVNGIA